MPIDNQLFPTSTFKELEDILLKIPPRSLIVTDIDNVLIYHTDKIIRPNSRTLYETHMEKLKTDFQEKTIHVKGREISFFEYLHGILIQGLQLKLLDDRIIDLFTKLRQNGHTFLALSQGKTGPYAEFDAIEEVRINHLKNLGLDFSKDFERIPPMILENLSPLPSPIFKEGIILTAKRSKALSLQNFLNHIPKTWESLVYIDDKAAWVKEIHAYFRKNYPLKVIWYQNQRFLHEEPDEHVAKKQFDLLQLYHKWVNDDEILKSSKAS